MITISSILQPRHIDIDLKETNQEEAIFKVASLLKEDERVRDWNEFYNSLKSKNPCVAAGEEFEICIPHARTNVVTSMVISVGRSVRGIAFPNTKNSIHYIFVIGVPVAMAADYLRIIGALARIFKENAAESALRAANNPTEFLQLLTEWEMKL